MRKGFRETSRKLCIFLAIYLHNFTCWFGFNKKYSLIWYFGEIFWSISDREGKLMDSLIYQRKSPTCITDEDDKKGVYILVSKDIFFCLLSSWICMALMQFELLVIMSSFVIITNLDIKHLHTHLTRQRTTLVYIYVYNIFIQGWQELKFHLYI